MNNLLWRVKAQAKKRIKGAFLSLLALKSKEEFWNTHLLLAYLNLVGRVGGFLDSSYRILIQPSLLGA